LKIGARFALFNIDKFIILAFTVFLLTDEANQMLASSGLKWVYLLLLSFGSGFVFTPLVIRHLS